MKPTPELPVGMAMPGGPAVQVVVRKLKNLLGQYGDNVIEVNPDRRVVMLTALIHEYAHAVEEEMRIRQGGMGKHASVPHRFIEGLSYGLVCALGEAGLLADVTPQEARRFARNPGRVPDMGRRI